MDEGAGLHSLRHFAAVAMLEEGVNIVAVSRILGHSSTAITGRLYGHLTEQAGRDAVARLGAAIGL